MSYPESNYHNNKPHQKTKQNKKKLFILGLLLGMDNIIKQQKEQQRNKNIPAHGTHL
jgi:hypothetical protein